MLAGMLRDRNRAIAHEPPEQSGNNGVVRPFNFGSFHFYRRIPLHEQRPAESHRTAVGLASRVDRVYCYRTVAAAKSNGHQLGLAFYLIRHSEWSRTLSTVRGFDICDLAVADDLDNRNHHRACEARAG